MRLLVCGGRDFAGGGFIMCINDDCPEEPEAAGETHKERIANWNARIFVGSASWS